MDGEIEVHFVKPDQPRRAGPQGRHDQARGAEPKGRKMGWVKAAAGPHDAAAEGLRPISSATAGKPGVLLLQTIKGD